MVVATEIGRRRPGFAGAQRLAAPGRLDGLDLARGLALVGMLAAHLLMIDTFDPLRPDTWIDVVNGRSSILFATLAGVSLALVTGGAVPLTGQARSTARARLAVRAGALWVIGVALMLTGVPVYVILPAYSLIFAIALLFVGLRARTLWVVAAVLAITMPFVVTMINDGVASMVGVAELQDTAGGLLLGWAYPFPLWTTFVVAGMALGRLDLRRTRVQVGSVVGGASVAAVAYTVAAAYPSIDILSADAHSGALAEVWGSGGVALAVIGACLLLCRTFVTWIVLPLRAAGSMPLTAYAAQIIVWAMWAFAALGTTTSLYGFVELEPFWPLTIGVIGGCTVWALVVGRGPLEDLLASLARRIVPSRGNVSVDQ